MNVIRRPPPPPDDPNRPRLGTVGQVYVSLAAAEQYQRALGMRMQIEESLRDLTELLLDAKESQTISGSWRMRSRGEALDISARVVREGRLMIVVSCEAREHTRGSAADVRAKEKRRAEYIASKGWSDDRKKGDT